MDKLDKLKEKSIQIEDGMEVFYPQFGKTEVIVFSSDLVPKFSGCFAVNNSTVAFCANGLFVTPYTYEVVESLRSYGFWERGFYVPLSNGEMPVEFKAQNKWQRLKEEASRFYHKQFVADCEDWCDKHGIRAIEEQYLKDCFKIPDRGVPVKFHNYEDTYYPICDNLIMDAYVVGKLGKFSSNNGRVVFIYRDGGTYVAKGYWIVKYLRSAGFQEIGLFVPFSNNEEIRDPNMKKIWESLPKKK